MGGSDAQLDLVDTAGIIAENDRSAHHRRYRPLRPLGRPRPPLVRRCRDHQNPTGLGPERADSNSRSAVNLPTRPNGGRLRSLAASTPMQTVRVTESSADDMAARLRFQRSLAGKRMGAGAVIRDAAGRVLLVKPTYKDPWELPGGVVEADESPASACRRELREELGLELEVGEMLCVDYNSTQADYVESLMFLFHVQPLTEEQEARIEINPGEIASWRYCDPADALALLDGRVGRRLAAVLGRPRSEFGRYLEDQPSLGESCRRRITPSPCGRAAATDATAKRATPGC